MDYVTLLLFMSLGVSCTQGACNSSETTTVNGKMGNFNFKLQQDYPGSVRTNCTVNCTDLGTLVGELNALGVDGECLLEAKAYFDGLADGTEGAGRQMIACRYATMESLCPAVTTLNYAVNGSYGNWSAWTGCSGSNLNDTRTRSCDSPAPRNGGLDCVQQGLGINIDAQLCAAADTVLPIQLFTNLLIAVTVATLPYLLT